MKRSLWCFSVSVMVLMTLAVPALPVGANLTMSTPEEAQYCTADSLPVSEAKVDMVSDPSTTLFMQTEWMTTPTCLNSTALDPEWVPMDMGSDTNQAATDQTPSSQLPQFSDPSEVSANESFASTNDESALTPLTGYFPGHTWSWQYGPDDSHVEAPEVARCMEGNWFRFTGYSQIIYGAFIDRPYRFSYRVDRESDGAYARVIRIYLNNFEIYSHTIRADEAYHADIVNVPDTIFPMWYNIKVQMSWCAYVEKAWSLRYWQVEKPDSEGYWQPVRTEAQMFHKERTSELKFWVPMGPQTKLNIETLNCHDIFSRYLYVLVDGNLKKTLYAPGAYEVEIADYDTPSLHELTIQLYYGDAFWGDYSKSIRQLYVSYDYRNVEVDWMAGYYQGTYYDHSQPQAVFDYTQAYYRTHDYRRLAFHLGGNVGFQYEIPSSSAFWQYYTSYFGHKGQSRWSYGLFCHHYRIADGIWGQAWLNYGFVIGDQSSYGLLDYRKWVLTHEHGHVEAMSDACGYKTDVYFVVDERDWVTPHYPSNAWVHYLTWVSGWW